MLFSVIASCPQMDDERSNLTREERDRWRSLQERQRQELESFDIETTAMGLNAADVAAASQEVAVDEDQLSTQGSTLSLSASSSTNSFTSHTPL